MTESTLLTQIGLSEKEAEIYQILLKIGKAPANKVLPLTQLKRTTVYSVLEELAQKEIVEKDESSAIIEFRAKHPYALKEYLETRVSQIKESEGKLDAALPNLITLYSEAQERPGVRYLESIGGFKKVYEDILQTKKELVIFTSAHDQTRADMSVVINENINKQKKLGINTKAIWMLDEKITKATIDELKLNNVAIRLTKNPLFALPAQIIIYGQKIAITSLKNEIVTTLIENENIATSLKNIFDFVWSVLETESAELYSTLPTSLPTK
ncbi:MAG TPA: helix-turn-helix domain-containing protein [bacterium]|nr:helix-turn-helix domain-containing protein [bacterium]